jgi:hypothetical protein
MNYLLIRHRVADFSHGKAAYDDHSGAREQAGLKEKELLHDIKDTNQVVLLFEVADIQRAQNFAESSELLESRTSQIFIFSVNKMSPQKA